MSVTQTQTQICNQALAMIAVGPIVDFLTDTSVPAQNCRLFFDTSALELLERFPWSWAARRVLLNSQVLNPPVWGFTTGFQLPADYVRLTDTDQNQNPLTSIDVTDIDWRIENGLVLINATSISLLYISNLGILDLSKWSPLFVQTMIHLMASKLALPLTRSIQYFGLHDGKVKALLDDARWAQSVPEGQTYDSQTLSVVRR